MSGIEAIAPAAASAVSISPADWNTAATLPASPPAGTSFADMIGAGLAGIDQRVSSADALVRSFALGNDVPLHQVTFALEQARLSVELAMQVQNRLIEGYRQLMNMQL
jgi:flagellar hook-basal body complex protein FliE